MQRDRIKVGYVKPFHLYSADKVPATCRLGGNLNVKVMAVARRCAEKITAVSQSGDEQCRAPFGPHRVDARWGFPLPQDMTGSYDQA